jgi:hypothetical protein
MSHAHTVIEPAAGLTVLIGPNNCGKSAVVTALQILAHNSNSTYVLRHHEKTCEVIVETDDGHTVKWSRSKSGSPKYVIDGQDFDRLKRGTPAVLDEILRLPKVISDSDEFDIHFGQQKEPVFLLNDTGKAAAQFFASSSDAIRLVEMQARHKTKVGEAKRDHKRLQTESERLEAAVEVLSATSTVETQLQACEKSYDEFENCLAQARSLEERLQQLPKIDRRLRLQDALARPLTQMTAPPQLEPTKTLEFLVNQITQFTRTSRKSTKLAQILGTVPSLPKLEDELRIEQAIADIKQAFKSHQVVDRRLQTLQDVKNPPQTQDTQPLESLIISLEQVQKNCNEMKEKKKSLDNQLKMLVKESERWAESNPVCPTCGAATDAQRLLKLKRGSSCHG